jgi:hypothetical protein
MRTEFSEEHITSNSRVEEQAKQETSRVKHRLLPSSRDFLPGSVRVLREVLSWAAGLKSAYRHILIS